ncbi:MAG TPA: serine hydrolase domain-containing protein [bacterium]|jgi:CubicO group peptidase (beta-lactamase class C family)|nr:serine hydrolase domain-containing protein [bacterium]
MMGGVATLRAGSPDAAGLDETRVADAGRLITHAVASGVFPGAVALLARGGMVVWHEPFGHAQVTPIVRPMQIDAIFDLASLTKVLATLPVALRLWQDGIIDLDAPAHEYVPEFAGAQRDAITLRHLLAHTSGLPSWIPLYLNASRRSQMLAEICRTPLVHGVGETVDYSDLGILLLGFAMERAAGRRIDALVDEHVTATLGLDDAAFNPQPPARERCAATEAGNKYEREKAGDAGAAFPWRTHVLVGEVHDGNAYYGMAGVAPHAGFFATAAGVAAVAYQWLRPGAYLPSAVTTEALADQRESAREYPRGLGWILHHPEAFFRALGPRSFGHTGFTGTSVAVDPDEDLLVVLLTNRVHPNADDTRIHEFRVTFHNAVMEGLR